MNGIKSWPEADFRFRAPFSSFRAPKCLKIRVSDYFTLGGFGSKSTVTFWRGYANNNPCILGVLGLGEHRLQSLSTFHRVVKKLARISGQILTLFDQKMDLKSWMTF